MLTRVQKNGIVSALMAGGIIVSGATIAPPSAFAANCYGDYCSGKDPVQAGCSADAYIAVARDLGIASLQVRYSPTCKTNWAKLVVYPTGIKCVYESYLDAVQDTGYKQSTVARTVCNTRSETVFWTPMIYSPVHKVKAVVQSYGTFTEVMETGWA